MPDWLPGHVSSVPEASAFGRSAVQAGSRTRCIGRLREQAAPLSHRTHACAPVASAAGQRPDASAVRRLVCLSRRFPEASVPVASISSRKRSCDLGCPHASAPCSLGCLAQACLCLGCPQAHQAAVPGCGRVSRGATRQADEPAATAIAAAGSYRALAAYQIDGTKPGGPRLNGIMPIACWPN